MNARFIAPGMFICFQGVLGSGKTLSMTRIGAMAYASGMQVYANYDCSFAKPITSLSHLLDLRNAVLLLDELQSLADSRDFKNNIGLSQWILIVRKLGLSILYTTQFLGQVDLRIRHVTSYVHCCEASFYHGYPATKCTVLRWRGEGGTIATTFLYPHTSALYSLYDTYDYNVKLTRTGREATFNSEDVLNEKNERKR